jgi:hypothetical protein
VYHPTVGVGPHHVRRALTEATAEGIQRYVPSSVGILVIGVSVLIVAALAHYGLGVPAPLTAGGGTLVTAVYQIVRHVQR